MNRYLPICLMFVMISPSLAVASPPEADPLDYSGPAWSPYVVGALIGLLSMATFYFSSKALGASSAYAALAGMLGRVVAPQHTKSLKYFKDKPPVIDWGFMLVVGVVVGAFLAAWQGNELANQWLPPMWAARFGDDSLPKRLVVAMLGGVFMAFGARLAGGCTSGHGISGTMQLSVGSWIAVICFFIGGIITAMLMFRL
jgi:uncharacterized protein